MLTREEFNYYVNYLIDYRKTSDKISDFFGISLFDGKLGVIIDDFAKLIIKSLNLDYKEIEESYYEDLLDIIFDGYFDIPYGEYLDDPELKQDTIRIDKNNLYDYFINPKELSND